MIKVEASGNAGDALVLDPESLTVEYMGPQGQCTEITSNAWRIRTLTELKWFLAEAREESAITSTEYDRLAKIIDSIRKDIIKE